MVNTYLKLKHLFFSLILSGLPKFCLPQKDEASVRARRPGLPGLAGGLARHLVDRVRLRVGHRARGLRRLSLLCDIRRLHRSRHLGTVEVS